MVFHLAIYVLLYFQSEMQVSADQDLEKGPNCLSSTQCMDGTDCFRTGTAQRCSALNSTCTCQRPNYVYNLGETCEDDGWRDLNCLYLVPQLQLALNITLRAPEQLGGDDSSPFVCIHGTSRVCQRGLPAGSECEEPSLCSSQTCRRGKCCRNKHCTYDFEYNESCETMMDCKNGMNCIGGVCAVICKLKENKLHNTGACTDYKLFNRLSVCKAVTCTREDCCPQEGASTSATPATVGTGIPTTANPSGIPTSTTPESTDIPKTVVISTPIPSAAGNGSIFSTCMFAALGVAILVFLLSSLFYFWFTCQRSNTVEVTYPRMASISSLSTISLTHV